MKDEESVSYASSEAVIRDRYAVRMGNWIVKRN
jgi:hypothetical protein